jgi:hypothetical protein
MEELERQLVELDLDLAKAKRYRREQKEKRKSQAASGLDTSDIEKALKKGKEAIGICKAARRDIIEQLLSAEAAKQASLGK